ncbi:TPA: sn-glycerol-3-phosphate ABC transporter ATP-binding protein UgpC, partial [Vibrio cholerae]
LDVHQTLPIWVVFDQLHLFDQQGKRLITQPHACSLNSKIATR